LNQGVTLSKILAKHRPSITQHTPTPMNSKPLTFGRLEENEEAKAGLELQLLQKCLQMTWFTPPIVPKHYFSPSMAKT